MQGACECQAWQFAAKVEMVVSGSPSAEQRVAADYRTTGGSFFDECVNCASRDSLCTSCIPHPDNS